MDKRFKEKKERSQNLQKEKNEITKKWKMRSENETRPHPSSVAARVHFIVYELNILLIKLSN